MQNNKIKEIYLMSKQKKILASAAVVMLVAIVALTLHFLILPAVTMEKVPICGIEEHEHNEGCYKQEKVLVCGLDESESHHHTDECYAVQDVLVCTKQEHKHTAECFEKSDSSADIESEKDWKSSISKAKITDDWANNIAQVAQTQLNYKESKKNFVWNENGDKLGYTRYGDWFGNRYADWNNMFVAFCFKFSNIPYDLIPYKLPVYKWIESMKTNDIFEAADDAKPQKGDIIFLDKDEDGKADSTAIVVEIKKSDIVAVEGNVDDEVKKVSYTLDDKKVSGFGKIARAQSLFEVKPQEFSATKRGTYYKQVRSLNELRNNDTVIIVSVEGNYALVNNKGNTRNTNIQSVVINPVKGNPDYYTIGNIPSSVKWKYTNRTFENSGYRIDARYADELFVPSNQAVALNIRESNTKGCWTLSSYDGYYGYRNYVNYYYTKMMGHQSERLYSNDTSIKYAKTNDMLILKEVNTTLTIPDDATPPKGIGGQPGSAVKPSYAAYINPTGEIKGSTSYLGADCIYSSDPSTSQIESQFGYHIPRPGKLDFDAQSVDDGKALTDKSVIYGNDDYDAFKSYDSDEFSVTLSALGQNFSMDTHEEHIPIDVLFILDLSGSMNQIYGDQNIPRAEILVNSMNKTIDNILKSNPQNRVCAVGYNSNVTELLPLGRPKKNAQNEYLKFIRRTDGEFYVEHQINVIDNNKTVTCQYGTYTQLGISRGVELLERNRDTTTTIQVKGESVEVARKPVIILVSDGEPTHCTSQYMNVSNAPYYGDGIGDTRSGSDVGNPKGVLGYYTILSANYYKRMAGIHYNNPASMYTVAFGMVEKDMGHTGQSAATKHYCSTVMNPTPENIEYLKHINEHPGDNLFTEQIEGLLYSLLKGTYRGDPVRIGAKFDLVTLGSPHIDVPVILDNPYQKDYNYSDKAFLGNEGSQGLNKAFDEIINMNSIKYVERSYETLNHVPIVITDPIGEGMQLNSEPVLRINGKNYLPTGYSIKQGVIYYEYHHGEVPMDDHSKKTVDTNRIEVTVTKDSRNNQKVKLFIPDSTLPIYAADETMSFYYEALPVRLIYKVGLSDESKTAVQNLAPGQSAVFYTNNYQGSDTANAVIEPNTNNKYYKGIGWKQNTSKTSNTTQTKEHSLIIGGNSTRVEQSLGNNGKLVFTKPAINKNLSVEKKWLGYDGEQTQENLPEKITAILYRTYIDESGKTVKEDVLEFTLDAQNGWKKTFTYEELNETLGREYKYYVSEKELEGYKVKYEADGVSSNTEQTPILITNRYKYGDIILPSTGGRGTILITSLGAVLMITALGYGYFLIRRKKGDSK